jgi:hypothetical protein
MSEGEPSPRPLESGRIEQGIVGLAILGALGWLPYMVNYWRRNGWPDYSETYFVGLVVLPLVIFGAGRLLATGVTFLRRWWSTPA